jgi:hypothetical protein
MIKDDKIALMIMGGVTVQLEAYDKDKEERFTGELRKSMQQLNQYQVRMNVYPLPTSPGCRSTIWIGNLPEDIKSLVLSAINMSPLMFQIQKGH